MKDIAEYEEIFDEYVLKPKLTVQKRQTDADDRSDLVWVGIEAENDDFIFYGEYELTYGLYNEGWLLDDISKTNSGFIGKRPELIEDRAARERADTFLSENIGNIFHDVDFALSLGDLVDRSEENDKIYFFFKLYSSCEQIVDIPDMICVEYAYTPWETWHYDTAEWVYK